MHVANKKCIHNQPNGNLILRCAFACIKSGIKSLKVKTKFNEHTNLKSFKKVFLLMKKKNELKINCNK